MIKLLKRFAKKIERLNEHVVGYCEGEICNRNFCPGVIEREEGSCCCSSAADCVFALRARPNC